MRPLLAIAVVLTAHGLAGCGRVGFDARGDGTDGGGAIDGPAALGWDRIFAGDQTICGIHRGRAYCWGSGTRGEIGDGGGVDRREPTAVGLPAGTVTDMTQGEGHGCAIVDAAAYCWGTAELGDGSSSSTTPHAVTALPGPVTSIAAGESFTCAVAAGGAYCWGSDTAGRLGNGSGSNTAMPGPVALPATAIAVDAGNDHAMALLADGTVWGWGHNDSGALGFGQFNPQVNDNPIEAIAQGALPSLAGWHACVLVGDGVRCWGLGTNGELGDGASTSSPSPVTPTGLGGGVSAVATGGGPTDFDASCAVVAGAVSCWGNGLFGRLGQGAPDNAAEPVDVVGLPANVVEVAIGFDTACARFADRTLRCWGRGDLGQLGDGAGATSYAPVVVRTPP